MGFPNAEVNIVNPGSTGGYSAFDNEPGPDGDLCANLYVFTSDQEMVECCSCFISPNALHTLSLDGDLTANALPNPVKVGLPNAGVIKVVASYVNTDSLFGGTCSATTTNPDGKKQTFFQAATGYTPYGSLRTWITHSRETVTGSSPLFTVTETSFRREDLSYTELYKLQAECNAIQQLGSGIGQCTCGVGD